MLFSYLSHTFFMYLELNQVNEPKSGRNASPEKPLPSKGLFGNGSERQDLCTGTGNRNRRSRFSRILGYRASIQDTYLRIGAPCPFLFNSDFLESLSYRCINLLLGRFFQSWALALKARQQITNQNFCILETSVPACSTPYRLFI